ncbi:MAG: hypothetical protein DRJ50_13080, partial [Actinobacteria bacterium]
MMTTNESEIDHHEAHELQEIVKRLKEVRRRFVQNGGGGDRFDQAEEWLDSVIDDLDSWLKPGGQPGDPEDLSLRLAAVEEIIESVGLPGYARVVASVRETLATFEQDEDERPEEEPPAPQRFQPPPSAARPVRRPRAPAARPVTKTRTGRKRWVYGLLVVVVVIGGCMAAALALGVLSLDELIADLKGLSGQIVVDEPKLLESLSEPSETSVIAPSAADQSSRAAAQNLGQLVLEIESAEAAMSDHNLDSALQHLAAAAAIDRHHRAVVSLAESLIDDLLRSSDRAFDHAERELAAKRLEDAGHLARSLYLDTSAIDQMARKHAAMTSFDDITP